jgi:hypothetical protein
VKSASLHSVGYDRRRHLLECEFRQGRIYQYFDVPAAAHRDLLNARSIGAYFNRHIKPAYRCRRVRPGRRAALSAFGLHANRTAAD